MCVVNLQSSLTRIGRRPGDTRLLQYKYYYYIVYVHGIILLFWTVAAAVHCSRERENCRTKRVFHACAGTKHAGNPNNRKKIFFFRQRFENWEVTLYATAKLLRNSYYLVTVITTVVHYVYDDQVSISTRFSTVFNFFISLASFLRYVWFLPGDRASLCVRFKYVTITRRCK